MSFFISNAMADAAAPAAAGPMGGGFEWIFLVGFLVIFYLMIWRPQAKRAKEQKNLLSSLQKGDEVVTTGGIAGKITKVADDFVVLEVSDSGPGIPEAERERVFDRFYRRAGEGGAGNDIGSGLGLAIVRVIADRHGAQISLGEAAIGGLRVQVRFPAS